MNEAQQARSSIEWAVRNGDNSRPKKAYDLIWTNELIFKLHQLGIKGRTLMVDLSLPIG
jgi:hypothetical protein